MAVTIGQRELLAALGVATVAWRLVARAQQGGRANFNAIDEFLIRRSQVRILRLHERRELVEVL